METYKGKVVSNARYELLDDATKRNLQTNIRGFLGEDNVKKLFSEIVTLIYRTDFASANREGSIAPPADQYKELAQNLRRIMDKEIRKNKAKDLQGITKSLQSGYEQILGELTSDSNLDAKEKETNRIWLERQREIELNYLLALSSVESDRRYSIHQLSSLLEASDQTGFYSDCTAQMNEDETIPGLSKEIDGLDNESPLIKPSGTFKFFFEKEFLSDYDNDEEDFLTILSLSSDKYSEYNENLLEVMGYFALQSTQTAQLMPSGVPVKKIFQSAYRDWQNMKDMVAKKLGIAIKPADALQAEMDIGEGFSKGDLNSVVFIDIDLMRLWNKIIGKQNVNILLDVLQNAIKEEKERSGNENAVSLRRGGDEFVLAISVTGENAKAVAQRIKTAVENTIFAVGDLAQGYLNHRVVGIIERNGGRIDTVGKQHTIIVPQLEQGKQGRERLEEFLDKVNEEIYNLKQIESIVQNEPLNSITLDESSSLNQTAINNQARFTLSVGVSESSNYMEALETAAAGKDKAKEEFKARGYSKVADDGRVKGREKEGETIVVKEDDVTNLNEGQSAIDIIGQTKNYIDRFPKIQKRANELERMKDFRGTNVEGSKAKYCSTQNALRQVIAKHQENGETDFSGAIICLLQALDYFDLTGEIEAYKKAYNEDPGSVRDKRVDNGDFKVDNEAHGYIAGDEIIALLRMLAMKNRDNLKLFEYFNLKFVERGGLAGPMLVLVPINSMENQKLTEKDIGEMFDQFMEIIRNEFNQASRIKIGQMRVIWDRFKSAEENAGNVVERISRTKEVYEDNTMPKRGVNVAIKYDDIVEHSWVEMETRLKNEAIEDLGLLRKAQALNARSANELPKTTDVTNYTIYTTLENFKFINQAI